MKTITYPNESLRIVSVDAELPLSTSHIMLCNVLGRSCFNNCVGMSAPQLGENVRIIAVKLRERGITIMINPKIIDQSDSMQSTQEGCMSVPDIYGKVQRPWSVNVEYTDEVGVVREVKLDALDSAVVQHEIDHLDGVLFFDHIVGGQRKRIDKKLAKRK